MEAEEYLETRLQDQIKYYSAKSRTNRKYYHLFKLVEIIIAVLIPFLTGFLKEHECIKYAVAILSVVLAICTGIEVLYKFQDKWMSYRSTSEALKQEKYMYQTKAGPYKSDQSLPVLAERVETILAKENATWNQLMHSKEEHKHQ